MTGSFDPRQLARRLARLDLGATTQAALAQAAGNLRAAVRQELSQPPGAPHDVPWLRDGTLRDSIGISVNAEGATIGSTDPVALDQECGTRTDPPRPFLAPAAAADGAVIAASVGAAVVQRMREKLA